MKAVVHAGCGGLLGWIIAGDVPHNAHNVRWRNGRIPKGPTYRSPQACPECGKIDVSLDYDTEVVD